MAAAGTGLCPHTGGAGIGHRRWPWTESVLSKPQSSPTARLILLVPFLLLACFLSPQRHRVALRRGRREKLKFRWFPGVSGKGGGSREIETRALGPPRLSLARNPGKMPKPHGLSSLILKLVSLRGPYVGMQDVPEGCSEAGRAWKLLALGWRGRSLTLLPTDTPPLSTVGRGWLLCGPGHVTEYAPQ